MSHTFQFLVLIVGESHSWLWYSTGLVSSRYGVARNCLLRVEESQKAELSGLCLMLTGGLKELNLYLHSCKVGALVTAAYSGLSFFVLGSGR